MEQFSTDFNLIKHESELMEEWQTNKLYQRLCEKAAGKPLFRFLDGPPFVSSDSLHNGHMLIGFGKSTVNQYKRMTGFNVENKLGFDCHGLPIEMVVNKMLGVNRKEEVMKLGIDKYNAKCKEVIHSFSGAWESVYNRIARWIDYENQYKTMDTNFMETVWWVFKQLWEKNLVYRGYRIMPYSTACATALSNFEASGDDIYKEVNDPAIFVKFKLIDNNHENTYLLVWTTTPWTLPANVAVAVNPELQYVKIQDQKSGSYYILAKDRLLEFYGLGGKKEKSSKALPYNIIQSYTGAQLVGLSYEPPFNYYLPDKETYPKLFTILSAQFVEATSGTGLVHISPSYGADDFDVVIQAGIMTNQDIGYFGPVDDHGLYTEKVHDFVGKHVHQANPEIIQYLKNNGVLVKKEMYTHNYPHCWRTDTPLIYRAVSSFFVKVTAIKDDLIANNKKVNWVPEHVGAGRFHQWLNNVKDWGISRSRYFGTPIPVWVSDDGEEMVCVGSIDELVQLANLKERPTDLHMEFIDHIQIPSKQGKGMLKHVSDVLDCWFESGAVPFGQLHYPFENSNHYDNQEFLSDFIMEGIDQTRGWFYTLMVLSTALYNKPAFKNVICAGLILAGDGKKMSKRLGNFVNPTTILEQNGADAMRLYLLSSPAVRADSFKFNEEDIGVINKRLTQCFNAVKFFIEHVIKLEKDGYKFDPSLYLVTNNVMDQWIIARTGTLLKTVREMMEQYRLWNVWNTLANYIEDLCNWYIKFNRNRLKGRFVEKDEQLRALSTLNYVLINFSIISAPFMPYLSETIYQQIKNLSKFSSSYDATSPDQLNYIESPYNNLTDSVHLMDYPSDNSFLANDAMERKMKRLQDVSCAIRSIRAKTENSKSAKIPLKEVTIAHNDQQFLEDIKGLETYLKEEINSLNINYVNQEGLVNYSVQPNHKSLGQKYKAVASQVKTLMTKLVPNNESLSPEQTVLKITNNRGETQEIVLDAEDYTVVSNINETLINQPNILVEMDKANNLLVIVNSERDAQVLELYHHRLFITIVQNMRKITSLRPWNPINIYYKTASHELNELLSKNSAIIAEELLYPIHPANDLSEYIKSPKLVMHKTTELDDIPIEIVILLE